MLAPVHYLLLADGVLVLHMGIVLFVAGGLVLTVVGNWRGWPWVNGWAFRLAHLLAIAIVVAQAWLGRVCPLTVLEMWLRSQAQASTYTGGFVAHWVGQLLYHDAPPWVFLVAYTAFGLAVLAAWWWYPPRRRS